MSWDADEESSLTNKKSKIGMFQLQTKSQTGSYLFLIYYCTLEQEFSPWTPWTTLSYSYMLTVLNCWGVQDTIKIFLCHPHYGGSWQRYAAEEETLQVWFVLQIILTVCFHWVFSVSTLWEVEIDVISHRRAKVSVLSVSLQEVTLSLPFVNLLICQVVLSTSAFSFPTFPLFLFLPMSNLPQRSFPTKERLQPQWVKGHQ